MKAISDKIKSIAAGLFDSCLSAPTAPAALAAPAILAALLSCRSAYISTYIIILH